jgi:hypothetical protein
MPYRRPVVLAAADSVAYAKLFLYKCSGVKKTPIRRTLHCGTSHRKIEAQSGNTASYKRVRMSFDHYDSHNKGIYLPVWIE